MKINIEDISSVKKMLYVEIPEKDVVSSLNDAYHELKKTVNIKGFRRGKTPRLVLERLYGKKINEDITTQFIKKALSEIINKNELKLVGSKNINTPKLKTNESYKFNLEIDVKPEINEIDFKNLNLEKKIYKISKEEIALQLEMIQKKMVEKKKLKKHRPIKKNDLVTIEYEGFIEEKFSNKLGKSKNFIIKIGNSTITKEFDSEIEGMNINEEKDIYITFPTNYHDATLSNVKAKYKVKINEINEEILPEINDEMAKKIGSFENLSDLKNKILENLEEGYKKRAEQELNEEIFKQLIEKTTFELPESLIQYELEAIMKEAERSFQYHNKSLKDLGLSREALQEKYLDLAKKQVRRQLILNKIIKQEKINLSDKELEKEIEIMSANYANPIEKIKTFYEQNPDKLESFKQALLEKKAIEIIIRQSSIKKVEVDSIEKNTIEDINNT